MPCRSRRSVWVFASPQSPDQSFPGSRATSTAGLATGCFHRFTNACMAITPTTTSTSMSNILMAVLPTKRPSLAANGLPGHELDHAPDRLHRDHTQTDYAGQKEHD